MRFIDTDKKIRETNDMVAMCEVNLIQAEQALKKTPDILAGEHAETLAEIAVLRKMLHALNDAVGDLRQGFYKEV